MKLLEKGLRTHTQYQVRGLLQSLEPMRDIRRAKAQSLRVARTREAGRAMSQAGLDSAMVAKDNGLKMKKRSACY